MSDEINNTQKDIVILPLATYHSYRGEYFFGQTEKIFLGGGYFGWGGLVNPPDSNVNLYFNAASISNFSKSFMTIESWVTNLLVGKIKLSPYIAVANQAITPSPEPKVKICSASFLQTPKREGDYLSIFRLEPERTLVTNYFHGMLIIPPGKSLILYFVTQAEKQIKIRTAFGWWEEKISE